MATVILVGGPHDGRSVNVTADRILFPVRINHPEAIWTPENEPTPGYIDGFGDWQPGIKPVYENAMYVHGVDGQYHYQQPQKI